MPGDITAEFVAWHQVVLTGFGFSTRECTARIGGNLQTHESIDITASTLAAFKPAAAPKEPFA